MLAAVEGPSGVWRMIDPQGREYGRIEIRRIMNDTETLYKALWRSDLDVLAVQEYGERQPRIPAISSM